MNRGNQGSPNNMSVNKDDATLDNFKSNNFADTVWENTKESSKYSGIIENFVSGPFQNRKSGIPHWSVIYVDQSEAWMLKFNFMKWFVKSVLTFLKSSNDDILHRPSSMDINIQILSLEKNPSVSARSKKC